MIGRKLLLLVLLITTLHQTSYAQITKGTIMTGGSLGFQFNTDHQALAKEYEFHFTPQFGGFVAKNVVLGIMPSIIYSSKVVSTQTIDSGFVPPHITQITSKDNMLSLGLGPFARYYFKIGPKVYIFIHGSPSIMASWETYSTIFNPAPQNPSSPITVRTVTANWTIGPGLSFMASKLVAIESSIYYNGTWHQANQFKNGNLLGNEGKAYVDHGMVLNVGIQVYFERNKKEKPVAK